MSEAYEVLKDDEKRARYDQYGEMGVNENPLNHNIHPMHFY